MNEPLGVFSILKTLFPFSAMTLEKSPEIEKAGQPAGWFDGRTDGKPLRAKTISTPEDSVIDVLIIKALDVKLGP